MPSSVESLDYAYLDSYQRRRDDAETTQTNWGINPGNSRPPRRHPSSTRRHPPDRRRRFRHVVLLRLRRLPLRDRRRGRRNSHCNRTLCARGRLGDVDRQDLGMDPCSDPLRPWRPFEPDISGRWSDLQHRGASDLRIPSMVPLAPPRQGLLRTGNAGPSVADATTSTSHLHVTGPA